MQMNPEGIWDDLSQAEVDTAEQIAEIIERARMEVQNRAVDEQVRREELAFVSWGGWWVTRYRGRIVEETDVC